MQTRKQVARLTLKQQKEIHNLYDDVIKTLTNKLDSSNELTSRWAKTYMEEIKRAKWKLRENMIGTIFKSTKESAYLGSKANQDILKEMFKNVDFNIDNNIDKMFTRVNYNVVSDIISGDLYKDNKTLSTRIWNYGEEFEKDIQYAINQAILEKKSAVELSDDLTKYVKDPKKRGFDWGKVYPRLAGKTVEYNAMRLARTSINHAYQNSTIQSSQVNPFIEGIKWHSAFEHGRTCQLCMDRATIDEYGLGDGVFPKDEVPLDHPNGLCTMLPYITKTSEEVAKEIREWVNGADNKNLDKWYNDLGEHFSGTRIDNIEEKTVPKFNYDNYKKVTEDDAYDYAEKLYKNKLTDVDKDILNSYVGTRDSFSINEFLYSGKYDKAKDLGEKSDLVEKIDNISKIIKKDKLPDNLKLDRMVDDNFLSSILKDIGIDNAEGLAKSVISDKTARDELESVLSGVEYTNKGFLSTSYDIDQNRFRHRPIRMELYADKGTNAIITDNHMESEVLLDKDTKLEFIGFDTESIMFDNISRQMIDRLIIKVRVLGG